MDENDKKIEEINKKMKELKEEKNKIKKEKNKDKRINTNNNNANSLIRVSTNFDKEIISVQEKRIENGIDEVFTSKPKITELIIKHKCWNGLKADLLNYNFKGDDKNDT